MKQKLHLHALRVLLLVTLLLGGGIKAWADTSTKYSMSGISSPKSGTEYTIENVKWKLLTDGTGYLAMDGGAIHAGSGKADVSYLNMTTSGIGGVIKSVVVNAKNASGATSTVSVTVGGTNFTSSSTKLSSTATDYTFTGTGSGEIVVSLSQTSAKKALYLYYITVTYSNKTTTTLTLDKTNETLTAGGSTLTITPTVTYDGGTVTAPTITWATSDATVATVSDGVVTPVKEGAATITASYAGDDTYEAATDATCEVSVTDARTAVNLVSFTSESTTLIKGETTRTAVTNDKAEWSAAYTYTTSDASVATVGEDGTITAIGRGVATISCELNVSKSDATYKVGATNKKTIEVTVKNPTHTVTFSVNGKTTTATFEEEAEISFPSDPANIDDNVFCGWVGSPILGTQHSTPEFVVSPVMGNDDVTYYATFAETVPGETIVQTLTIDCDANATNFPTAYAAAKDYTLSGKSFNIKQVYKNGTKLQWRNSTNTNGAGVIYNNDALTNIQSIVLTYDNSDSNYKIGLKVGASSNPTSGTTITPSSNNKVYTFDCSAGNYDYFVLTNGDNASYLTSIVINYTATGPDTYDNYCTSVSDLAKAIITLSDDEIEMIWGETGKTLTATVSVDDETIDETVSFTSSSDNLTIDGDGNISCDVPGNYTITAIVQETSEHQAGQAVCIVTVGKQDIELAFAESIVKKMDEDLEYTQTATVTPAAYDGSISYSITDSSSEDAEIDEESGELVFINSGVIEVTATATSTDKYNGGTATYKVYVRTTPTLAVADQNVTFGETFTLNTEDLLSGEITLSSNSDEIATVSGLVITPQAVGTVIITVDAAESETYVAGSTTFSLNVSAPEALASGLVERTLFYESFDTNASKGGNDEIWNNNAGSGTAQTDNKSWILSSAYAADRCLKFGTSSVKGSAKTPTLNFKAGTEYTLTFKAAAWDASSEKTALSISTTAGTLSKSSITLTKGAWNTYNATFTANATTGAISIEASQASNNRFFLDEVRVTYTETPEVAATIPSSGIGTYCSQYPLTFDSETDESVKAYAVSAFDSEEGVVTLTKIQGNVAGGIPMIVTGAKNTEVALTAAASGSALEGDNLLLGTLAPTYVEATVGGKTNFVMNGGEFRKMNSGVLPANKAYLPLALGSEVKALTLRFVDNATGIVETRTISAEEAQQLFDLSGRRLLKPVKGINVIGGRKVVIK